MHGILTEWVKPDYNHGPFVLMHGDLGPYNILVDANLNILSILDWEWSRTVPIQLFVPPSWLTNHLVLQIARDFSALHYLAKVFKFIGHTTTQESTFHNPEKLLRKDLPLTSFWGTLEKETSLYPMGFWILITLEMFIGVL